jgi:serine acetyltransferase
MRFALHQMPKACLQLWTSRCPQGFARALRAVSILALANPGSRFVIYEAVAVVVGGTVHIDLV